MLVRFSPRLLLTLPQVFISHHLRVRLWLGRFVYFYTLMQTRQTPHPPRCVMQVASDLTLKRGLDLGVEVEQQEFRPQLTRLSVGRSVDVEGAGRPSEFVEPLGSGDGL